MTDDLDAMGVERMRERSSRDPRRPWMDDVLALYLDGLLTERTLRSTLRGMGPGLSIAAAHAAVLRASSDARLSAPLYATQSGGFFSSPSFGALFLGAVYRRAKERVVTYDLDVPLHGLGRGVSDSTILVNTGRLGDDTGLDFHGVLINKGVCGTLTTPASLVVNLGSAKGYESCAYLDMEDRTAGFFSGARPVIEYTNSQWCRDLFFGEESCEMHQSHHNGPLLLRSPGWRNIDEKRSALRACFDEVIGLADKDPLALFDKYGPKPGDGIAKMLDRIIEDEGGV